MIKKIVSLHNLTRFDNRQTLWRVNLFMIETNGVRISESNIRSRDE